VELFWNFKITSFLFKFDLEISKLYLKNFENIFFSKKISKTSSFPVWPSFSHENFEDLSQAVEKRDKMWNLNQA
jgi:hypothetical protein